MNEWIWTEIIDIQCKLFLLLKNNFILYIVDIFIEILIICIYIYLLHYLDKRVQKVLFWKFWKKSGWKNNNCEAIKKIISRMKRSIKTIINILDILVKKKLLVFYYYWWDFEFHYWQKLIFKMLMSIKVVIRPYIYWWKENWIIIN